MATHLLLHGIGVPGRPLEPGEADVWISPAQMHGILDVVAEAAVGISVDDGNASDVDVLLPALVDRGLRATFFPIAGRTNTPGSLSESAIRELRDAGMNVGTHGMHHRPWRRLDASALHDELVVARKALEDLLGERVVSAACPHGAYDRRTLRVLRQLEYQRVYTSDSGSNRPQAWLQARTSVRRWDDASSIHAAVVAPAPFRKRSITAAKRLIKRLR